MKLTYVHLHALHRAPRLTWLPKAPDTRRYDPLTAFRTNLKLSFYGVLWENVPLIESYNYNRLHHGEAHGPISP